jgi:hypothetical protein
MVTILLLLGLLVAWAPVTQAQTVIEVRTKHSINIKSRGNGKTPITFVCTATFDPATVVPLTVTVNGVTVSQCELENEDEADDVGDVDEGAIPGCAELVCHVPTRLLGVTCATTSLTVTAQTIAGEFLQATPTVRPVPCRGR